MKRFTNTRSKLTLFFSLSLIAIIALPLAINLPNIGFKGEIVPSATSLTLVTPSPTSSLNVEMSWTPVTPVTNYKVYRNDSLVQTTTSTSYVDTVPGPAWYEYHVIVFYSEGGNSEPSNSVTVLVVGQGGTLPPIPSSLTWSKEYDVISTESTLESKYPAVAVDHAGNVHVAWQDLTDYGGSGTDQDVFYKYLNWTTGTWSNTEVVSTESTGTSSYYNPVDIGVDDSGTVHVIWPDSGSGNVKLFYKQRNPKTGTWSALEIATAGVSPTVLNSPECMAVDGLGNVYITWYDASIYPTDSIFFRYRSNSTGTWSATETVGHVYSSSRAPSIAVDSSGNVHVTWHDYYSYWRVYYCKRTSGTWGMIETVSTESTASAQYPRIATDSSNNPHVVWEDVTNYGGSGTDKDIFYKKKTGATWGTTEVVSTESTSTSSWPTIFIDSQNTVHVAWQDQTNYGGSGTDWDIFYKKKVGSTWSTTEVVSTESTLDSLNPSIVVDGMGNTHVVWDDLTNYKGTSGTDKDIFYKCRGKINIVGDTILALYSASGSGTSGDPYVIADLALTRLIVKDTAAYTTLLRPIMYAIPSAASISAINSLHIDIQEGVFTSGNAGVAINTSSSVVGIYSTTIRGYRIGVFNGISSSITLGSASSIIDCNIGLQSGGSIVTVQGTIRNCEIGLKAISGTTTLSATSRVTLCATGIEAGSFSSLGIVDWSEIGINITSAGTITGGKVEHSTTAIVIDTSGSVTINGLSMQQNGLQLDVQQGSPAIGGCTFDVLRDHVNVEGGASPTFSGNTYRDYFLHYPFANATTLAKVALDANYEIIVGIEDTTPVYSDTAFPNTNTLLRTNLLLELGFNPSNVRLYINGGLVTAATFIPAGILYRATVKNATLEITYFDEIRNVNWVSVPQITVLSPANNSVYYGYQAIDVRAHVIDYDDNLASVMAWFNHTTGVVTSQFALTSVLPYIYNNTFAVSSLSLKGNWTLWVNATDSSGHSTISNSTVIDYRGAPPVVAITSPTDGSTQKVDFRVNATVTDADADIDDVWVEVRNATGALKATLPMVLQSPTKYSTIVDVDGMLYADGYEARVKANDTFGNLVFASITFNSRPKQVTTLLAAQITYQVDGTTANTVILATATIANDPVVQSKEVVVYIPATWQDASGGIIRRGSTEYNDIDLADPVKLEFAIPTYQAADTLTFAINTPRFTQVAEEDVNASYIYMEYTVTARRDYTGIHTPSLTLRQMDGEWAYHVELLVGSTWVRVDDVTYGFAVTGDYFKSFMMVVPSVGESETIRLRVVMELVPGSAVDTTKITTAIIVAPSIAAGMAVVAYMSPLKKRLPGWVKLLLTAAPAIVTFVLIVI